MTIFLIGGMGRPPASRRAGRTPRWDLPDVTDVTREAPPRGVSPEARPGARAPTAPARRGGRRRPPGRADVADLVEPVVDRPRDERDRRLDVLEHLLQVRDPLGRAEQGDGGDVVGPAVEEEADGVGHRAAGREHRVEDVDLPAGQVVGQAVRVGDRLEGLLVALHPEEADLGARQQPDHALEHPQARAQDRHDERLGVAQLDARRRRHGRLDLEGLDPHLARRLVGEQRHQLLGEAAEGGGVGPLVPEVGQLVGDEPVVRVDDAHG